MDEIDDKITEWLIDMNAMFAEVLYKYKKGRILNEELVEWLDRTDDLIYDFKEIIRGI